MQLQIEEKKASEDINFTNNDVSENVSGAESKAYDERRPSLSMRGKFPPRRKESSLTRKNSSQSKAQNQ